MPPPHLMGEIQPLIGTEGAPSSLPTSLQFHLPTSRDQTCPILTQISGCSFLSLVLVLVMNYALPAWEIRFPESLYVYDFKLEELWGDLESRNEAAVIILLVFPGRHRGWLPFLAIATPLALSAQTQTWFCKGTALLAFSHVIIPLSPVNSVPTQTNGPAHSS